MSKVIHGDMFVIPNTARVLGNLFFKDSVKEELRELNWDIEDNDILIEVWVTSDDSSNWGDHFVPWDHHKRFPRFLPYDLLKDVMEGEAIYLYMDGHDIRLTAKQEAYRYKNFGPFEKVVQRVVASVLPLAGGNMKEEKDKLQKKEDDFFKNHTLRMKEIDSAIKEVNRVMKDGTIDEALDMMLKDIAKPEIPDKFDKTLKLCRDLVALFSYANDCTEAALDKQDLTTAKDFVKVSKILEASIQDVFKITDKIMQEGGIKC